MLVLTWLIQQMQLQATNTYILAKIKSTAGDKRSGYTLRNLEFKASVNTRLICSTDKECMSSAGMLSTHR